ncbi:Uncharacterised protein [Actinobaculum suis]|uniref:Uncharacterized protein n=1 Tax=Actinobaculum suis TaxID=1657 RepID=A0A7Z8Y7V8_9ACTO|nr:hypothetical protein [Actinobaculum suis]VDG75775.1 Uncharacterised protein [Actinobaculum suis]
MMKRRECVVAHRGLTAVPNWLIHDSGLSYAALGLALTCLSMPVGMPVGYRRLAGRGLGEAATRKALAELEARGLRFRFTVHVDGKIRDVTVVSDMPLTPVQAAGQVTECLGLEENDGHALACTSHPQPPAAPPQTEADSQAGVLKQESVFGREAVPGGIASSKVSGLAPVIAGNGGESPFTGARPDVKTCGKERTPHKPTNGEGKKECQ